MAELIELRSFTARGYFRNDDAKNPFLSLLFGAAVTTALQAVPAFANPSILFDVASERVIESDDPFQRWYPASLEQADDHLCRVPGDQAGEVTFSSPVRISKAASQLPPSKMGYPPGSGLDARQRAEDHHGQVGQ